LKEFPHCPGAWYSSEEDSRERKRPRISESTATPIAPPLAFVNPLVEASTPVEEAPAVEDQAFPEAPQASQSTQAPAVEDQAFPVAPQASQSTQAYADRLLLAFNYLEGGEEPPPVEEDPQDSENNDSEEFDSVALLAAYEAYIQQIQDRHDILAATQTVVPEIASRASRAHTEPLPEASGGASPGPEGLTGFRPRAFSLEVASSALQEEQQSKISKPPAPGPPPFEYTGNPEESDAESDAESDTTIHDEPDAPQSSKAPATPQKAQKASADSPSDAESDTTIHDESDAPQSAKARSKAPATPEKAQKASADSPSMPPRRGRAPAAYKITSIDQMREILQLTGRDDVYRALRTALSDEMTRIGWVNKTTSGLDLFEQLRDWLINHKVLKALKPRYMREGSEASNKIKAALSYLISDRSHKVNRAHVRRARALAGINEGGGEFTENPTFAAAEVCKAMGIPYRPAITVHVIDPTKMGAVASAAYREIDWYGPAALPASIGVLEEVSLAELAKVAMKRVPKVADGVPPRVTRAFYGAMSNGPPRAAGAAYALNPENVRIGDAEELEAWLKTSEAKPLRLCAVLHRPRALLAGPRHRPETPPPDGWDDLDQND
jgi:hypothetical protein